MEPNVQAGIIRWIIENAGYLALAAGVTWGFFILVGFSVFSIKDRLDHIIRQQGELIRLLSSVQHEPTEPDQSEGPIPSDRIEPGFSRRAYKSSS